METRYFYILRFAVALSDIVLINLCFLLSFYLSKAYQINFDKETYKYHIIICTLIWIVCTGVYGMYSGQVIHKLESIYRATWRSIAMHIFLFLAYLFFSNQMHFPHYFLVTFYILMVFGFLFSRFIGTVLRSVFTKNYDIRKAVAVLGTNQGGIKLAEYLEKQSSLNFMGFLGEAFTSVNNYGELQTPSATEQLKTAADLGVEEVFVSVTPEKMNDLTDLILEGEKQCVRLKFVPDLTDLEPNFKFEKMGNFTVLCARKEPLESIENRFKKRLFDIIVSSLVLIFICSWLYPILAILIKIQSPGPVFFKQLRTGRNNKPFWCYKLRSMRMNSECDQRQACLDDERVTPLGHFLRKTSLDEFPQFFNVFLGQMSIIGPRPHMLLHTREYRKTIDKYMVRQFLKPGISGWAQINGYRGETKEKRLIEKRVEYDIWYMENWSVMLDIKIMFFTVINIFKGEENAY